MASAWKRHDDRSKNKIGRHKRKKEKEKEKKNEAIYQKLCVPFLLCVFVKTAHSFIDLLHMPQPKTYQYIV